MLGYRLFVVLAILLLHPSAVFSINYAAQHNENLTNGECHHAFCRYKRFIANDKAYARYVHANAIFEQQGFAYKNKAKQWNSFALFVGCLGGAAAGCIAWELPKIKDFGYIKRGVATAGGVALGFLLSSTLTKSLHLMLAGLSPKEPTYKYARCCYVTDYIKTLQYYQEVLQCNVAPWLSIDTDDEQLALSKVLTLAKKESVESPLLSSVVFLRSLIAELRNTCEAANFLLATNDNATNAEGISFDGAPLEQWRQNSILVLDEVQAALPHLCHLKKLIHTSNAYYQEQLAHPAKKKKSVHSSVDNKKPNAVKSKKVVKKQ